MRPGDFVIVNDVIGCVQTLPPLTVLCQDGVIRELRAQAELIISGQQYALLLAEKAMGRVTNGNPSAL